MCLSAAASAARTAIRDMRLGCGGAAFQFGESRDALVVASALHAIMDSPGSLAKIKAHWVSSRMFNTFDLDSLSPPKPEGLLHVARGLAWRSLQLPLAAARVKKQAQGFKENAWCSSGSYHDALNGSERSARAVPPCAHG